MAALLRNAWTNPFSASGVARSKSPFGSPGSVSAVAASVSVYGSLAPWNRSLAVRCERTMFVANERLVDREDDAVVDLARRSSRDGRSETWASKDTNSLRHHAASCGIGRSLTPLTPRRFISLEGE